MTFTAVIVLHDSAPDLARLLDSLDDNLPERPQLVVVDSGSRDAGADLARERGAEVVELPGNPGFGAASNEGVARASTDVVALLNPDVELLDAGLLELVGLARERDALLVPRLLNADGSAQRSAHPLPGRARALLPALVHPPLLPAPLRLQAEPWRADAPRAVGWAIAAALVAPTATLRALGPFDPDAFLFYEDLDLCLRARAAGVSTELRPEVRLRHVGAHATGPAFGGEPHDLQARRRREVVAARLGRRALMLDDAAQGLTFATRIGARTLLRRDAAHQRAQLTALLRARRAGQ
jgi:N-acetylglucosaminyl-diphospho-decaprenol L-rhamnosyltransferase